MPRMRVFLLACAIVLHAHIGWAQPALPRVVVLATGSSLVQNGTITTGVVIAFLLVGLFGLQVWLLATGGPVLAVGPAGLWIKTRPTRGQAIWLPWEAIGLISRRRWSFPQPSG